MITNYTMSGVYINRIGLPEPIGTRVDIVDWSRDGLRVLPRRTKILSTDRMQVRYFDRPAFWCDADDLSDRNPLVSDA